MRLFWVVAHLLLFCFLSVACASGSPDGIKEEAMDFQQFGEPVRKCSAAWQVLLDDCGRNDCGRNEDIQVFLECFEVAATFRP
jgi:hypothetical protein